MTIKDIAVGQQFKFKGFTYTKLNDDGLVLLDDLKSNWYQECCFDNVDNNYETSLIRHYINSPKHKKFLGLTNKDFSTDKFGYKKDNLFLLSLDEWEKYKEYIKPFGDYSWLRSGNFNYASGAYSLSPSGASNDYGTVVGSRAVRPALYLNLNSTIFANSDCEV